MVTNARVRAGKKGVPCTITQADVSIPKLCPVLGIPIQVSVTGSPTDDSPSLDRIIPQLGYVPGNVVVISNRANRIKNDATFAEIKRLYEWMKDQQ